GANSPGSPAPPVAPTWAPPLGHVVLLTGVGHYEGGSLRIVPRSHRDCADLGVAGVGGSNAHLSFSVAPNPARKATFSFTLPEQSDVENGILDVAGRQVASLDKGTMGAGNYTRDGSGETSDGRSANAGVYFARMKANGAVFAIRTVYLGR